MTDSMSDQRASGYKQEYMSGLIDSDIEAWARLSGLLAMLALPPVRMGDGTYRRRLIEIEIKPRSDQWVAIDGLTIEQHRLIFYTGMNGTRRQWLFERPEGVPRWRTPSHDSGAVKVEP